MYVFPLEDIYSLSSSHLSYKDLSKCVFKYVQMRSFSILAVSLLPISPGLLSLPGFPWIHGLAMCSLQGRTDTGRKK